MSIRSVRFRATIVIGAVIAAGLFIATPATASASTSNAKNAHTILASINAARSVHSLTPYDDITLVDARAQVLVKQFAKCGYPCVQDADDLTSLPPESDQINTFGLSVSGSKRPAKLATDIPADFEAQLSHESDDVIGVGYLSKGSKSYAYVILMSYSSPNRPLNPGSVSLPSKVVVGTTITPKIAWPAPVPALYNYDWKVGGVPVATTATYTPSASDLGAKISLVVTGRKNFFAQKTATSNTSSKVIHGTVKAPSKITIDGNLNVGQPLTAPAGGWSPSGVVLSVQWYRNHKVIAGATGSTYTPVDSDLGSTIDVKVTGGLPGFTSKSVTTKTHTKLGKRLQFLTPTPTITGVYSSGSLLTAHLGTWAPAAVTTISWKIAGKAVAGQHSTTFTLPDAAVNHSVTVSVESVEPGYVTVTKTSAPTITITGLTFHVNSLPFVSGSLVKGHTLSVTPGNFTPAPTGEKYVWLRNGHAISGATHHTYKVTSKDVGQVIRVQVTITKLGFTTWVQAL